MRLRMRVATVSEGDTVVLAQGSSVPSSVPSSVLVLGSKRCCGLAIEFGEALGGKVSHFH